MLLNRKIILFLLLVLAIYIALNYLIINVVVVDSFKEVEQQAAVADTRRIVNAIAQRLEAIKHNAIDYVHRHALAERIRAGSGHAEGDNHNSAAHLQQIELAMRLLYSNEGRLIAHSIIDSDGQTITDINTLFIQPPLPDDRLIYHATADSFVTGIINTRLGPMLIASLPVLSNLPHGGTIGTFIQGRLLNQPEVLAISRQIGVDFTVFNDAEAPELAAMMADKAADPASHAKADVQHAYAELKDIYGAPVAWIKTVPPLGISLTGKEAAGMAFFIELIGGIMLVLGIWFFLLFFVIGRIRQLTRHVTMIEHEGDLTKRLNLTTPDEIGTLARKLDQLIEQLQKTSHELADSRDKALELSNVKSEFLATMSHEIRTPLNGMLAFAELLQDSDLTPEQKRYAELICSSGENLLGIISNVLDFSKIEADKIELEMVEFDLRNLVEEVSEVLAVRAHDKGIDLVQVIPPNLREQLKGDPTRLRQVLINLLGNSIKFTEHGQVVIRVSTDKTDNENELDVRFEVEDTGIGIMEKQKQNIFKAFTQEDGSTARKFGGSGLGLTISQQLVRKMGSNIFVESKPGEGSLFWFTARFETLLDAESKTRIPTAYLRDKHAVIVDDNQTNLEILELQLKNWGLNTASYTDVAVMLASLRDDKPGHCDVLLLDRKLNDKDGMELVQEIRKFHLLHATPVIMLSSSLAPTRPEQLQQLNITHVLQKPVRQADLYKSLSEVLGKVPSEYRKKVDHLAPSNQAVKFNARVLVVEDNAMNQLVVSTVLEKCGCSVVIANDGQEAIHFWLHNEIDIILMDLRMPVMDGFTAATAIREKEREQNSKKPVPIIALTADVVKEVKSKALTAGINDYLTKPFTQLMLTTMFARHIPHLRYQVADNQTDNPANDGKQDKQTAAVSSHIDLNAIELLRDLVEPDDNDNVVVDMITSYFKSSQHLMQSVKDFQSDHNLKAVAEAAHSLQSSSGYLGAFNMVAACKQITAACKADDAETVARLCQSIQQEYEQVLIALNQLIEKENT